LLSWRLSQEAILIKVDQQIYAARIRRALDTAALEAIGLRETLDLGDLPLRLHKIREEIQEIEAQLAKEARQLIIF